MYTDYFLYNLYHVNNEQKKKKKKKGRSLPLRMRKRAVRLLNSEYKPKITGLTLRPARLLCKFINALASRTFFSRASINVREKSLPYCTLSLHPPHSKCPFLSRPFPILDGSHEQFRRVPLLQALVIACTTADEEMAYTKAASRLPAKEREREKKKH